MSTDWFGNLVVFAVGAPPRPTVGELSPRVDDSA